MKIFFTIILSAFFSNVIFSQITTEQIDYNYKLAYCVGTKNSTAWIGEKVVVIIEGETPERAGIAP